MTKRKLRLQIAVPDVTETADATATHQVRLAASVKLPNPRPNNGSVPVTLEWLKSNAKITQAGCWEWLGTTWQGYGFTKTRDADGKVKNKRVHIVAMELTGKPCPTGRIFDHLCRNRACFNPDHLEPVTIRTNTRRGKSLVYVNERCPRCGGTEFYKQRWGVRCAACTKAYQKQPEIRARSRELARKRLGRVKDDPAFKAQRRAANARYRAKLKASRNAVTAHAAQEPQEAIQGGATEKALDAQIATAQWGLG